MNNLFCISFQSAVSGTLPVAVPGFLSHSTLEELELWTHCVVISAALVGALSELSSSSSEPLKRVAASRSSFKLLGSFERGDWCHTALDIMFSSSEISKGSTTVVKVPIVTLFRFAGKVLVPPFGAPWCGGNGGGGGLQVPPF